MAAMHCLSCDHPNSASAKFCEHCGSALNLRLCKKCEAVNDTKASRCHSCDAPLAAPRLVRRRGVPAALAGAALVIAACAAGALYLLDRTRLEAAPARAAPATPTQTQSAPAPVERNEPAPAAAEVPAKPKPAARIVTHTRATPFAPAPAAPPAAAPSAALPIAPQPIAPSPIAPLEYNAPPVTHTRRAVAPPDTKTGSN